MKQTPSADRLKLVKKLAHAINKKARTERAHAPISKRTEACEEVVAVLEELRENKLEGGEKPAPSK